MITGTIYKIENKITKQVYIGQTTDFKVRIMNHFRSALNYGLKGKLYDSIREYGQDAFSIEVISEIYNEDRDVLYKALDKIEIEFIKIYDSIKNGLNTNMNESRVYSKNYNSLNVGKPKRRVNKYDLEGNFIKTYDYIRKAALDNNITAGHICNCCKYKTPTAGGYLWQYEDSVDMERCLKRFNGTYSVLHRRKANKDLGLKPKKKYHKIENFDKSKYTLDTRKLFK